MGFIFSPEHVVINDLFGNDIKYLIPEYQRPYSWDCQGKSDKNNQINVMWDDLIQFYDNQEKGEYFFGSMVLIEKGNREYEVVDGQQRLTTLDIFFSSIKCFIRQLLIDKETVLQSSHHEEFIKLVASLEKSIEIINNLLYNTVDYGLGQERKLKIEKFNGFDFDTILKSTIDCIDKRSVDLTSISEEQKTIALRYFDNRDYFIKKLNERFLTAGQFSNQNRILLSKFVDFLKNRISVVRIKTPKFDIAYQIFEILNNRGLPLSNKDLLRNFIIKEFDKIKASEPRFKNIIPSEKWNDLDQNYVLDNDFIGRWVESRKASQQKYSAFNDLHEMYKEKYKDEVEEKKIEVLFNDLKLDLENYTIIVDNGIRDSEAKNKVEFLLNAGNERYTLNLLLSLFRFIQDINIGMTDLKDFLNSFERYLLYIILNPASKFSNAPIYEAIQLLNSKKFLQAKKVFELDDSKTSQIRNLISGEIKDNSIAKLLIAKYIWILDSQISDDVVQQGLNYERSTLEHIIPQKPEQNSNWMRDFTPDFRGTYTYRLGNMTLLTKIKNSKAKNYDFEIKKKEYEGTKLAITQRLSLLPQINQEFIEKRHEEIVDTIARDLGI